MARRRAKQARIGSQHRVKKEDTIAWFKQRFDGIILVGRLPFITRVFFVDHRFSNRPSRCLYFCRLCVVYAIAVATACRFECVRQKHATTWSSTIFVAHLLVSESLPPDPPYGDHGHGSN